MNSVCIHHTILLDRGFLEARNKITTTSHTKPAHTKQKVRTHCGDWLFGRMHIFLADFICQVKHTPDRRSHQFCLSRKSWSLGGDQENNEFYWIFHSRRNRLVAAPGNDQGWQWRLTRKMSRWFCLEGVAVSHKTTTQFFFGHFFLSFFLFYKKSVFEVVKCIFYRQSFCFLRKVNLPWLIFFFPGYW